jgi:hypothetical protein
MTYKEAESLIIDAYFKDEIKPYNGSFCFCGTLNNNDNTWRERGNRFYNSSEFIRMEYALLSTINSLTYNIKDIFYTNYKWGINNGEEFIDRGKIKQHPNYENALFEGMVEALKVLKQIHQSHGEDVDEEVSIKKRVLVTN